MLVDSHTLGVSYETKVVYIKRMDGVLSGRTALALVSRQLLILILPWLWVYNLKVA
jgi:hypothetical protein